jgi:rod shape-determining protein MreD
MPPIVRHILIGLFVVLLDWLLLGRLRIAGAAPDVILLYVIYMALQYGRLPGMIAGFVTGFFADMIYGTWGIFMFIKTLVGFLIGMFPLESRDRPTMLPQQVFSGSLIIALFHNGLMIIFLVLLTQVRSGFHVGALWIGSAIYTAIVGALLSLIVSRGAR